MNRDISIDFAGVELDINYDYYPATFGRTEHGMKIEPDEPSSLEICMVQLKGLDVTDLVEPHLEKIEEKIWGALGE